MTSLAYRIQKVRMGGQVASMKAKNRGSGGRKAPVGSRGKAPWRVLGRRIPEAVDFMQNT